MRKLFLALPVLLATLAGSSLTAHAGPIDGTWSGSGYVQVTDGKREKVRCRVTYSRQTDKVFSVKATCASPSNKIYQTGEVLKVGNDRYVGDFYNNQFDISGRVRVSVSGSSQTVSFKSASGHGSMSLSKR